MNQALLIHFSLQQQLLLLFSFVTRTARLLAIVAINSLDGTSCSGVFVPTTEVALLPRWCYVLESDILPLMWALSENYLKKVSYKTTTAGLEGFPQKSTMVLAKGILNFAKEEV